MLAERLFEAIFLQLVGIAYTDGHLLTVSTFDSIPVARGAVRRANSTGTELSHPSRVFRLACAPSLLEVLNGFRC